MGAAVDSEHLADQLRGSASIVGLPLVLHSCAPNTDPWPRRSDGKGVE